MSWNACLYDVRTGLLAEPVDIPSFTWSMTVSDSSFSTSRDKGVGVDDMGGLQLPWSQIPGDTPEARASAVMAGKRGVCLFWKSAWDDPSSLGVPVLAGALGVRTSSRQDVSFPFDSMLALLSNRYLVNEGGFGSDGKNHFSTGGVAYRDMSLRGIASEVGWRCTMAKPGGELPIDWTYRGEKGSHQRTDYHDWNIQNQACADILAKLANVQGGPDMQFRPYLADNSHIRFQFLAGSDGDVFLGQKTMHALTSFAGGGTFEDMTVDHAAPVQRVYATGSGTDAGTICHLAEDLTLVSRQDPWPLSETTFSNTDDDNWPLLKSHADAVLNANKMPLMQVKGTVNVNDAGPDGHPLLPLGSFWPGEMFLLQVEGFPDLPDAAYTLRLMEMSGDESANVKLTFDVADDPVY